MDAIVIYETRETRQRDSGTGRSLGLLPIAMKGMPPVLLDSEGVMS